MKSKADINLKKKKLSNTLAAQWLELDAFTAGAWVQSLVGKRRFHKPCGMEKKKKKQKKNKTENSTLTLHHNAKFIFIISQHKKGEYITVR